MKESIENLVIDKNGIYIDCTFGAGGHSAQILKKLTPNGRLFSFDLDEESKIISKKIKQQNFKFTLDNFKNISNYFCENQVSGVLLDCGVSSPQIDTSHRGFSFNKDAPLDMRFGKTIRNDAKKIVNNYSIDELTSIFKNFGQEEESRKIAKQISIEREKNEIQTTFQLAGLIRKTKKKYTKNNPATKVFQAIRMEINDEVGNLRCCLQALEKILKKPGRALIITFHSIEDRIIKDYISTDIPLHERDLPLKDDSVAKSKFKLLATIFPSAQELQSNKRSRSAKLRVLEKYEN